MYVTTTDKIYYIMKSEKAETHNHSTNRKASKEHVSM